MRNVTGLILILCGLGLVWSGWARRAEALAAKASAARGSAAGVVMNPSLAAFGAIVRPVVYVGLGYLALKASVAYALFDGGRMFSPFDLFGFLFLLTSYGTWLFLRTAHWEADADRPAVTSESPLPHAVQGGLTPRDSGPDRPRGTAGGARDRAGAGGLAARVAPSREAPQPQDRAA